MKKKWNDIIIIGNDGKPKWYGGAYTLAFVYSNRGNFLLKGYGHEVKEYLEDLKSKGYKYIVNQTLWHREKWSGEKRHRNIWKTSSNDAFISKPEPSFKNCDNKFRWTIYRYNGDKKITLKFKRLPKKWVSDFEKIIY